jgi:negative regulator of sigma E activity
LAAITVVDNNDRTRNDVVAKKYILVLSQIEVNGSRLNTTPKLTCVGQLPVSNAKRMHEPVVYV